MPDIFQLFDGTIGAGGSAAVQDQHASSFSDVDSENALVSTLSSGSDSVDLLVDYSDFANFVTFNSAESYVTLTADDVLNSYPVGGTADDAQQFLNSLDGFQRFFLSGWPSWSGHLRFDPSVSASYVRVDDVGTQDGSSRTSFMSPGTGSLSVQGWVHVPPMTGSNDVLVVFQKLRQGTSNGYTVFTTGSAIGFQVVSGSTSVTVTGALAAMPSFFAAVIDHTTATGSVSLYVGTTGTFPVLVSSASLLLQSRFDLASGSFYMGSGSVSGKVVRPFTGSLDSVSVWSAARTSQQLSGTYNRKVYAQSDLLASWQFNDASPQTPSTYASVVRDRSGHSLDGRIQSFFSGVLGSGSYVNDVADPILSLDDPNVVSYIVDAQQSGVLYDRSNPSLIFTLFPEAFSGPDPTSQAVFSSFALTLARHFDRIKLYVNQLPNLHRVSFGDFDQAPDGLLEGVGDFLGWKLQGSFANTDALRYFVGRNVRVGPDANASLETRLSEVKSQLWRRVLQNLPYIYKTKGTAESVRALLRSYGADNGFIRLKEYARKDESTLPLTRVTAEKSVYALTFLSGSTVQATSALIPSGSSFSVELRVRFPLSTDATLVPTELSGALWTLSSGTTYVAAWYEKAGASSETGNVYVTSSFGRVQLTSASLFDDNFYNISFTRNTQTGLNSLRAIRYDAGDLAYSTSSLLTASDAASGYRLMEVGSSVLVPSSGQFWAQELRLWDTDLSASELFAHAAHFESYGRDVSIGNSDLIVHWRMADASTADANGSFSLMDSTLNSVTGTAGGFRPSQVNFTKFLEDYAYIPGIDYGWNQEKVRVFSGSRIDPFDAYRDERFVSLELNMYDALNEDISHIMTSYDELTRVIGLPVNKYREDYEGIRQMRETYFKRLQGRLNFRVFVDMLDFFDSSFATLVERLLPARAQFKGDELIVESHMLERPKYQYQLRPIVEGRIEVSGSITIVDRGDDE